MRFTIAALALAGVSGLSTAAYAQSAEQPTATTRPDEGLTDIVVTAQRREESLQKVPVAVTALSGGKLDELRVVSAQSLSGLAPSLTINNQGLASNPTIIIRGIQSGVSNNAVDPKVGIYLDGVYIGRTVGSLFDLADIQRIEVLRGPQGTLFGRNATGGALSIVTAPPKGEFALRGSVSYGNYDAKRGKISVDLPSFGPFSVRFSYLHDEIDGDVKNLIGGQTLDLRPRDPRFGVLTYAKRLGARKVDAGQVALRGEFGALTADYHFDYSDARNVGRPIQAFGIPDDATGALVGGISSISSGFFGGLTNLSANRLKVFANATTEEHVVTQGHSLTLAVGNDNGLNVKSISAYRKFNQSPNVYDLAASGGLRFTTAQLQNLLTGNTAAIFNPANAPTGPRDQLFTLLTSRSTKQQQYSQEFQVQYANDRIDVTGGVFIFHENSPATDILGILQPVANGVVVTNAGLIPGLPVGQLPFDINGDGVVNALDSNPSLDSVFGSGVTRTRAINDSFAGYAQATLHVTPTIDLTAGGRYTFDDREAQISAVAGGQGGQLGVGTYKVGYEKFTYTAIATWRPTDDMTAYGKLSTGYVAGGILSGIPYKPETLMTYEVGFKGQFFDNRLRSNIAGFYSIYDDLQLQNFVNGRQTFENAGKANIKGIEVELDAAPVKGLTLSGNFSWTDIKYVRFLGTDTTGNIRDIADIARPVYAPKYQARASIQYDFPAFSNDSYLFARVDGTYRSSIALTSPAYVAPDPSNATQVANAAALNAAAVQPRLYLLNARAGLADFQIGGGKASLSVFGQNLNNQRYVAFGAPVLRLTGARERGRTYGVELGVNF